MGDSAVRTQQQQVDTCDITVELRKFCFRDVILGKGDNVLPATT